MTRTPQSSRKQRPRRRLIAGALVAVLALAGIVASVEAAVHNPRLPAARTPSAKAVTVGDGGSTCGLSGLDSDGQTLPAAPTTQWVTVGVMAAPVSRTAGPGQTRSDGLRWCYAHTAAGALLAAANIYAMGSDPRLYRQILQACVADGPGRTAALGKPDPADNTGESEQIAGYKVDSYTTSAATIDLAFQVSDGQQIDLSSPMRWEDGDWKLQLADDGSPVFRPVLLASLNGYTPWAGSE